MHTHEYAHTYVHNHPFRYIFFSEDVCKTPIGVCFQTTNACCLFNQDLYAFRKQSQWLWEPLVKDLSVVGGERKTPIALIVIEQLQVPEDTVWGLEMERWITPGASDQDEGQKWPWLIMSQHKHSKWRNLSKGQLPKTAESRTIYRCELFLNGEECSGRQGISTSLEVWDPKDPPQFFPTIILLQPDQGWGRAQGPDTDRNPFPAPCFPRARLF